MSKLISATLVIAAIVHLLPIVGVLGPERLASLYGLDFSEPNLAILMRHRAVLFGLVGALLMYAAFEPRLQPVAFTVGSISAASFLLLAWSIGGYNPLVARIVLADAVALVALVVGFAAYVLAGRQA